MSVYRLAHRAEADGDGSLQFRRFAREQPQSKRVAHPDAEPDTVSRGRYFPHIVGNLRNGRGVPLSAATFEDALIAQLDSTPHSEWRHPGCVCRDCLPRSDWD